MNAETHQRTSAQPPMFGRNSYVLPDTVHTNIPRQYYDGAPRLWTYARALLIEAADVLDWDPIALYVHVPIDDNDNPTATVITFIGQDEDNQFITVVYRQEQDVNGRRGRWQLTIDGAVPDQGHGAVRPSPAVLADLIRRASTS